MLRIGGQNMPYGKGLKADFTNKQYTQPYLALVDTENPTKKNIPITYRDYKGGFTIFQVKQFINNYKR